MIVVSAISLVNIGEQAGGATGELPADGIPAAKTVVEHGPVKIVAAPAESERALHELARIGRADKVDRGRDQTADRRFWVDHAMANPEKLPVDRIGAAGGGIDRLHKVLNRSVRNDGVELVSE